MNHSHSRIAAGLLLLTARNDPFFLLVESISDAALLLLDPAGRVINWNAGAEKLTGFTADVMVSKSIEALYSHEDVVSGKPASDLSEALEQGRVVKECRRLHAGGGLFCARCELVPLYDSDRHIGFAVMIRRSSEALGAVRPAESHSPLKVELLHAIVDSTTDAVFAKDRGGRYLLANRAVAGFVGHPVCDIIGRTDADLFDPHSARWIAERDQRVMDRGAVETGEECLIASGVSRTYLATKAPYRDATGAVVGIIGISRDITDRKRAEQELALFRALIDRTTDGIEVIDPTTGRFLDVNEEACLAHGYTREEYLALHLADIDPLVAVRPWAEVTDGLRRTGNQPFESRHMRKDGSTFPVEVRVNHVLADREYLVAVVRDITERERGAAALRRTQERLQSVISSSPAVLYTLATGGTGEREIAWISENVRGMFGFAPEDIVGTNWWGAHVHADDRHRASAELGSELYSAGHLTNEYRVRHQNSQYRWVRSEVRLVRDATGAPLEVVGSWSDVTERKHIEDQFRQAQKMDAIGRLAGGVAHDFNNLLTVINGYASFLLGGLSPEAPHHESLTEILEAGRLAAELTAQLLAFGRKTIIEPKTLDLNDLVNQSVKMLRRLIGEDVILATVLAPATGCVTVDPGQIEQVLMNLAVNARDAMPGGGRLTIETRSLLIRSGDCVYPDLLPGSYVQLAVTDTGAGMNESVKARIFEPFFTTKEQGKGTGLGLATVYGIVKTYGGHIGVYSELGVGTTFRLLFPSVSKHTADPVENELVPPPTGTETVLLVEDDARVRRITRLTLQKYGYSVLEAPCGADAIRLSEGHGGTIHLLITDVVMPGTGGRDVAAAIRTQRPETKVLFMSGYTDDAVVRHGIIEAKDAFLQKPFTPLPLACKVRAVLDS